MNHLLGLKFMASRFSGFSLFCKGKLLLPEGLDLDVMAAVARLCAYDKSRGRIERIAAFFYGVASINDHGFGLPVLSKDVEMHLELMSGVRYAIYNPETKLLLSQVWEDGFVRPKWSDRANKIITYKRIKTAIETLKMVHSDSYETSGTPEAKIVSVTVALTVTGDATDIANDHTKIALVEHIAKNQAIYDKHLPAVKKDVDLLSKKDWAAFKTARNHLKNSGVEVFKL
jgi:hypothetical protein